MMRSALVILMVMGFTAAACGKYGAPVRSRPMRAAPAAATAPEPAPAPDPAAAPAEPDEEEPTP